MMKTILRKMPWSLLLLAVLMIGQGCFSIQPVARDYMTEDDFQFCLAQVTLDVVRSSWGAEAMANSRKLGTLLVNPPLHNGVSHIRTGKGRKALRRFSVDDEFTRPLIHFLRDPVACREFWVSLKQDHPTAWHALCEQRGMDEATWQPPIPAKPLFRASTYQPDASCTHSLTVVFSQDTVRVNASRSVERFRFHVRFLEIESGVVKATALGMAQHEWKRKFW